MLGGFDGAFFGGAAAGFHGARLLRAQRFSILHTMQAHRAETTVSEEGVITLRDVPLGGGQAVEVIVILYSMPASGSRYPLRGTPVTLLSPTASIAGADWEPEIGDRIRAVDEGCVVGVSYEDVMRSAEARLLP